MKHFINIYRSALIALALALPAMPAPCAERFTVEGVAAYVNRDVVTVGEVLVLLEPLRRELVERYGGDVLREKLRESYREAVEETVNRRLILDLYEDQERKLPEWMIERQVEELIAKRFKNDREALMAALAQERLTYREWRDEVRDQIIVSSMRGAHVDRLVRVAPREVRRRYDENPERFRVPTKVKLRMIVFGKGDDQAAAAEARRKAERALAMLKQGEDFAGLARAVSEGMRAERGGDWDWVEPARTLRRELAAAASGLGAGETSGVVETDEELYILRVEDRREARVLPFEGARAELEAELRREKAARLYRSWVARLRDKAYVKIVEDTPF